MTTQTDWNPMPFSLDINCHNCAKCAVFTFATTVKIRLAKDVAFFQNASQFDYHFFHDSGGQNWHAAVFYSGLHGGNSQSISTLPEGYSPDQFAADKNSIAQRNLRLGSYICKHCQSRGKHKLIWPDDAHFIINHKQQLLWAFNACSASALRDFISSSNRKPPPQRWSRFLRHIPSFFKQQKNRDAIVKKLNKLLTR